MGGGDPVRGVSDREEMACEGYGADEGEEIADADADEEVLEGGSGWCGEEEQACKGKDRSDGGGPARSWRVGGSKSGDDGVERDEDDNEAGDEGGLRRCGSSEARGLELVAGCEEEAYNETGEQCVAVDVTELAVIHDGQGDEGQGHPEKIKKKRRGVLEGVFDEDEGGTPDEDDCQQ